MVEPRDTGLSVRELGEGSSYLRAGDSRTNIIMVRRQDSCLQLSITRRALMAIPRGLSALESERIWRRYAVCVPAPDLSVTLHAPDVPCFSDYVSPQRHAIIPPLATGVRACVSSERRNRRGRSEGLGQERSGEVPRPRSPGAHPWVDQSYCDVNRLKCVGIRWRFKVGGVVGGVMIGRGLRREHAAGEIC